MASICLNLAPLCLAGCPDAGRARAWVMRHLPPPHPPPQSSSPTGATCWSEVDSLSSRTPPLPVVLFFLDYNNETEKYRWLQPEMPLVCFYWQRSSMWMCTWVKFLFLSHPPTHTARTTSPSPAKPHPHPLNTRISLRSLRAAPNTPRPDIYPSALHRQAYSNC